MARTQVAAQAASAAGLAPAYTAPIVDGDALPGGGDHAVLHVKNGGAGSLTVTVQTGTTTGGYAVADQTVTVPAGADRFIGPFPAPVFDQPATHADPLLRGKVLVDYSVLTSVTRALVKV